MKISTLTASPPELAVWRERYLGEMNCQVVHHARHAREGWTQSYFLAIGGCTVGYGSVLIGGPWAGTRTVFEYYLAPQHRGRAFSLFEALLEVSAATRLRAQSNDSLLTVMLHAFARAIVTESIVFRDELATALLAPGAVFRRITPAEATQVFPHEVEPVGDYGLEVDGTIVATGGVLFHYNRPYGDVFMEVAPVWRRRGLGAFLVQELKRVCRELDSVPCARCAPDNIASRQTCQKAGFVPCAAIIEGAVPR